MSVPAPDANLAALEERIGYRFHRRALLAEAVTHGSVNDGAKGRRRSYDRLEFLGDRVLGLITAERLLSKDPDAEEGDLATRYNALVNKHACAAAARAAQLGAAIALSPSEEASGGRGKDAILADVCEAVIAALYLDGGIEAARAFINRFWAGLDLGQAARRDAKTVLQEWAAARKRRLSYHVVERTGPDHAPRFSVDAEVEGFSRKRGEGASKREAQQAAAEAFLREHRVDD